MISRIGCADQRNSAYQPTVAIQRFAWRRESGILVLAAEPSSNSSRRNCQNRYPSPSLRPGPTGVRPIFHWAAREGGGRRRSAQLREWHCFAFDRIRAPGDIRAITKPVGGRAECKPLESSPSSASWSRSRDALRTMWNVASQAPPPAPSSPARQITTWPLVPSSAQPRASSATISTCRAASTADRSHAASPRRPTQSLTQTRAAGAPRTGGFVMSAAWAATRPRHGGFECSRRS